jgi:hypothetical protein
MKHVGSIKRTVTRKYVTEKLRQKMKRVELPTEMYRQYAGKNKPSLANHENFHAFNPDWSTTPVKRNGQYTRTHQSRVVR